MYYIFSPLAYFKMFLYFVAWKWNIARKQGYGFPHNYGLAFMVETLQGKGWKLVGQQGGQSDAVPKVQAQDTLTTCTPALKAFAFAFSRFSGPCAFKGDWERKRDTFLSPASVLSTSSLAIMSYFILPGPPYLPKQVWHLESVAVCWSLLSFFFSGPVGAEGVQKKEWPFSFLSHLQHDIRGALISAHGIADHLGYYQVT